MKENSAKGLKVSVMSQTQIRWLSRTTVEARGTARAAAAGAGVQAATVVESRSV